MSFCDELRKIEWENSYSNKKEEIIHREVEGLITGIKVLSRHQLESGFLRKAAFLFLFDVQKLYFKI